ncbi:MAG: UbiX family flavin prenyltransferase [Deltaproteobacteria bacterium]|nr:UbiX family flavin prenyltransferase [Deltaproteobacteria bacterium]
MAAYLVALTGASGAVYGVRLVSEILKRGDDVEIIISPSGVLLLKEELGIEAGTDAAPAINAYIRNKWKTDLKGVLKNLPYDDLAAGAASGSSLKKTMIVAPCSMGTLARIAAGISGNLIERAADCVLKERGTLLLIPRETPLNTIHLENMLKLSRMGAVILPAMPAFYTHPKTIDEMVDFVAGKALDVLGIENSLYKRWKK